MVTFEDLGGPFLPAWLFFGVVSRPNAQSLPWIGFVVLLIAVLGSLSGLAVSFVVAFQR